MNLVILTKKEADQKVSEEIINLINSKKDCVLGLATGSTPEGVYANLIKANQEGKVSFKNVTTFNLDEYVGLEETHPQSYRYFMNDHLFSHVDIDLNRTHVPGNKGDENDLSVYDENIAKHGGIDLQLLGIGSNGHIAFNEPGTPFDSLTHIVTLKESTIKDNSRFFNSIDEVPTSAITMGLKSIMNAKKIILMAFGKNKAHAICTMFTKEPNIDLPASILQNHNDVTIYCDEDAASLLVAETTK